MLLMIHSLLFDLNISDFFSIDINILCLCLVLVDAHTDVVEKELSIIILIHRTSAPGDICTKWRFLFQMRKSNDLPL